MKHALKITLLLIAMFIISQIIGLLVVYSYSPQTKLVFNETTGEYEKVTVKPQLPYGMEPPEIKPEISLPSILISMAVAVLLILFLMKIRATLFLRLWFFFVVALALALSFNALLMRFNIPSYIPFIIAAPLAFLKIFKRNMIVHNVTELLIYPGIAAVFVSILNLWTVIILLLAISVYDIYAVWHAGFMQKMAKFQINNLKLFAGFLIPSLNEKQKKQIELLREKYKNAKIPDKKLKEKKIKINLAILGGGDVVFPIIFAGVVFKTLGLFPAVLTSLFASIALFLLLLASKKGKAYPAMPFITAGCLAGLAVFFLFRIF